MQLMLREAKDWSAECAPWRRQSGKDVRKRIRFSHADIRLKIAVFHHRHFIVVRNDARCLR